MAFSPPTAPSSSSAPKPGAFGNRRVEIVTIPEKFYGVALTMNGQTQAERELPPPPPPPVVAKPAPALVKPPERKPLWPYLSLLGVLIFAVGGVFVYLNRESLFGSPVVPVAVTPPPKPPPSAPVNLSATSSGSAVSLVWVDGGGGGNRHTD
jgi:hypothetical protein